MADKKQDQAEDIVLIQGPTEDGQGVRALRSRPGRLDMTELRAAKKDESSDDLEIVRLHPRKNAPLVCDVTVVSSPLVSHSGPPRVTSVTYRRRWDSVFGVSGKKTSTKPILN